MQSSFSKGSAMKGAPPSMGMFIIGLFVHQRFNYVASITTYRIASNKRRGVHLIFDIFWGAFIQGRRFLEIGRLYEAIR